MPILPRLIAPVAALLLLTSPGFVPIGARTVDPVVVARPALWVVRDPDTTIYLFGTVHVLRPGMRWFGGRVKRAFDQSDTLVLEVLTPDKAAMAASTARLAIDPDGPPLTEKLDPATRRRYLALLKTLSLSAAQLEPARPWFAAVTLSLVPLERLGYRPDTGAEEILKAAATRAAKKTEAFETADQQLGYFAGMPEDAQIRYLKTTIDDAEKMDTEIASMIAAWGAGKPDTLADEMNESLESLPEMAETLLFARNRRWAADIQQRLARPGSVFVAVGAGHLAGKDSVLDELARRGLKVSRVQ